MRARARKNYAYLVAKKGKIVFCLNNVKPFGEGYNLLYYLFSKVKIGLKVNFISEIR